MEQSHGQHWRPIGIASALCNRMRMSEHNCAEAKVVLCVMLATSKVASSKATWQSLPAYCWLLIDMAVVTCLLPAADGPRRVASSPPPPDRAAAGVRVTIPLAWDMITYQHHPSWFFLWQVQKRTAAVCLFLVAFLHQNIVPVVSPAKKAKCQQLKRRRRILHKKKAQSFALWGASPTCFASQQKACVLYLRVCPMLMACRLACRLWLATSGNGTYLKSSETHSSGCGGAAWVEKAELGFSVE